MRMIQLENLKRGVLILFAMFMVLGTTGCWESDAENAAEDVGESIEDSVDDAGDAIEDATE